MPPNTASSSIPALPAKRYRPYFVIDLFWLLALVAGVFSLSKITYLTGGPNQFALFTGGVLLLLVWPFLLTIKSTWGLAGKLPIYCPTAMIVLGLTSDLQPYAMTTFLTLAIVTITALPWLGYRSVKYRYGLRVATLLLFASTAIGWSLTGLYPPFYLKQLFSLRGEYPIVDLSSRLSARDSTTDKPTVLTLNTETELSKLDAWFVLDKNQRWKKQMRDIHDIQYENFVRSLGFGVRRMIPPSLSRSYRIKLQNVPFSNSDENTSEKGVESDRKHDRENWALEKVQSTFSAELTPIFTLDANGSHLFATADFLHPAGLGHSPEFQKAYGFEPHGFHFSQENLEHGKTEFQLDRLELIGWLGRDTPKAYVLDHLPRMDEISSTDVPKRELDDFETSAFEKLNAGEMIVVEEHADSLRMLGAIRAIENCRDCHDVQRGEMLGAFSYFWKK